MSDKEMLALLAKEIEALKQQLVASATTKTINNGLPKSHRGVTPKAGRKYVFVKKTPDSWGKIPQQQADLARILGALEVDKEYTEAEVFALITERSAEYPSLANSAMDPTYVFTYYRGLAIKGNHAGFIARNFLRVIG